MAVVVDCSGLNLVEDCLVYLIQNQLNPGHACTIENRANLFPSTPIIILGDYNTSLSSWNMDVNFKNVEIFTFSFP